MEKSQFCAGLIRSKSLKVKIYSESSSLDILFERKKKKKTPGRIVKKIETISLPLSQASFQGGSDRISI